MDTTTPHPFTDSVTGHQDPDDPFWEQVSWTAPADLEPGMTFIHPHLQGQDGSPKTFTIEEVEAGLVFPGDRWKCEHRALRFRGRGPKGTTRLMLFLDEKVQVVF